MVILSITIAIISFIIILTPIIFIHELGHLTCARIFGVQVEQFSIGFGKTIVKWQDARNTIWKISLIPFGGYIKMFGTNKTNIKNLTDTEVKQSFCNKKLWQKVLIVFSGPLANYLLSISILTAIYDKITTILNTTMYLTWVVAVGPVTIKSKTFLTGTSMAPESL